MLIHQLSSGLWGKYEDLKDDMENCDNFMKTIKDIYEEHTNIPKKELAKVLNSDTAKYLKPILERSAPVENSESTNLRTRVKLAS